MKTNTRNEKSGPHMMVRPGMTLVELAVVIGAMLLLLSFVFPMAGAWKEGSFRAQCILNMRNVQQGVRAYANLNGLKSGDGPASDTSVDLADEIIGEDKFVERMPTCSSGGSYSFSGNEIPDPGELFMSCSLGGSRNHTPQTVSDW